MSFPAENVGGARSLERSTVTGERSESSTVGALVDGLVLWLATNGEPNGKYGNDVLLRQA